MIHLGKFIIYMSGSRNYKQYALPLQTSILHNNTHNIYQDAICEDDEYIGHEILLHLNESINVEANIIKRLQIIIMS